MGKKRKEEEKKVHYPVGLKPTTSRVFAPEACALPLCYNWCPTINNSLNLFFFGLRHSDQRSGIFVWIYLLRTKNFLPHASVFPDCPRKWKECLRSTAKIHFCRNLDNQEMIKNSTKCPREPLIISCRSYFLIFDDFRRSIKEECKN